VAEQMKYYLAQLKVAERCNVTSRYECLNGVGTLSKDDYLKGGYSLRQKHKNVLGILRMLAG